MAIQGCVSTKRQLSQRDFITVSLAIESFLPKKSLQEAKKAISVTGNPILWLPRTHLGASRDPSFSCRLCPVTTSGARPLLPSPGLRGPGQPGSFPGSRQRPALCSCSRLLFGVQAPAPPTGVACMDHSAESSKEPAGAWREQAHPRPAQHYHSSLRAAPAWLPPCTSQDFTESQNRLDVYSKGNRFITGNALSRLWGRPSLRLCTRGRGERWCHWGPKT